MKKVILFVVFSLLITACTSPDAKTQRALVGTWVSSYSTATEGAVHSTSTIRSDGSWKQRTMFTPAGKNTPIEIQCEGTLIVKNGALINTMTKLIQTNAPPAPLPMTMKGRIVRLTQTEMVTTWEGLPNEATAQKVQDISQH